MAATLFVAQWNRHQPLLQLDMLKPIDNAALRRALENRSHTFHGARTRRSACQPMLDYVDECREFHRLHQDLIGLQEDGMSRGAHLRVCSQQQGDSSGIGVAHRTYDREAISCSRHM